MYLKLPTRWMAILFFLFGVITWNACSKEYSYEKGRGSQFGDLFPGDGDSTGNGGDTSGDNDPPPPPPPPPPPGGGVTNTDIDFMKKATYINRAQVNNANLAVDRGTVQSVRDFGKAVLTRFTEAQGEMDVLGDQLKVAIPGQTDAAHNAVTTGFLDMEGRTFDIGYIDYQMLELQRAIDLYRAQIANGSDPRVKAYAQKYLPYLEQFLQTASQIRQSL